MWLFVDFLYHTVNIHIFCYGDIVVFDFRGLSQTLLRLLDLISVSIEMPVWKIKKKKILNFKIQGSPRVLR